MSNTQRGISSGWTAWKYDVYISYCTGDDTVVDLVDRLYAALQDHKGISACRDDDKPIGNSRFVIAILSISYAQSTRCLDELATVVDFKKTTILPVFYHVEPYEVRKQIGSFGEAFSEHEETPNLECWRDALTSVSNIAGWHLPPDGNEVVFIQDVMGYVIRSMPPSFVRLPDHVVGIDRGLEELMELCFGLQDQEDDVRFIGICGMGGIGKTTLASAFYLKVYSHFEGASFLQNVREVSRNNGVEDLQEQLFSDILKWRTKPSNIEIKEIWDILRCKKVLIVIDDVWGLKELEALAGSRDWFGPGSRIIITTRDEYVFGFGVDVVYKIKEFKENEALELFCLKAFKMDHPPESYMQLSRQIVDCAKGLPLAISVLGSYLHGRSRGIWEDVLIRLNKDGDHNPDILSVLRVSFDVLGDQEKQIFLDISCFFNGKEKDWVIEILESAFDSSLGIKILIERSLVNEVGGKLQMHDLLKELGQEIIRKECLDVPGKRSRLWLPNDIIDVLKYNQGTGALQGIALDLDKLRNISCHAEVFSKMHRLRFLQIRNVHVTDGPRYLSHELTFLEWSDYPRKSLPQNFDPRKLIELNLCYSSSIERLWNGRKDLPHLKVINVSFSEKLTRIPDLSCAPLLKQLIFKGCASLVEIHPSISVLKRLTCLNFKDCRTLQHLPSMFEMEFLQILILSGCSSVSKIPEFGNRMLGLLELYLDETSMEQLPSSVVLLTGLSLLSLKECKNLKSLPRDIGNLKLLKCLNICGCSKLETLPDSLGEMDCLEKLDASGATILSGLPSSMSRLTNLQVLSLRGCKVISGKMTRNPLGFLSPIANSGGLRSLTELNLSNCSLQEGTLPEDLGCLSSLVSLNFSKGGFVSLPKSIRQLSKLRNLNLESCKSLKVLPDLSSSINFSIGAEGSITQERLSSSFNLIGCSELVVNLSTNNIALKLLHRFLQGVSYAGNTFETIIPSTKISEVFSYQNVGPVVSMELPQQWSSKKWMGYALCAVFHIRRGLPVPANKLGKLKFKTHSTAHGLRCEANPDNLGMCGWYPSFACSQDLGQIESEHLWLSFVCGDYFGTKWQETCRNIEFTFKTLGTSMEVKKCGVRLIYEQDLDLLYKK